MAPLDWALVGVCVLAVVGGGILAVTVKDGTRSLWAWGSGFAGGIMFCVLTQIYLRG